MNIEEALAVARRYGLKVTKIHFHTGCGYLTSQLPHLKLIFEACLWFIGHAKNVSRVNVGGGLDVPHVKSDETLDLKQWAATLYKYFHARGLHVEVEPGEFIAKGGANALG